MPNPVRPLFAAACASLLSTFALAEEPAAKVPARERPRLVVMIAVDQMTPEQLQRLAPLWSGGFARFLRHGTVFREARLQYADTETGPGHATYGTGMNPLHHGIVGNDWVLPEEKSTSYCVGDPESRLVTAAGPTGTKSMSPRNVRAPGLIDRLKALDPDSLGFAVSSKDRAAIGMSGQRPDLALWWDQGGRGFVSSTWYGPALPPWVIEFDGRWLAAFREAWGGGWNALDVGSFEGTDTAPDDAPGELAWKGRRVFPYPAPEIDATPSAEQLGDLAKLVYGSPAGDQLVCELARRAVTALGLGKDEHVDVLCVSLSSCDTVGHSFGPRSREVTDVLLRADRQLEHLFADLDREVGAGRWIASLSSDHGVLDLPEALVQRGIGAERISSKQVGASIKAARARMAEELGEDFFLAYDGRGVRLSWTKIAAAGKKAAAVRELAASVLEQECAAWVEDACTLDELEAIARRGEPADGFRRSLANSFDEDRTPDVTLLQKPWKLVGMSAGTTHGTPYPYDVRIPLAFYGPGFSARESFEPASSVDALPTLMAALGLEVPAGLDGRVLVTR